MQILSKYDLFVFDWDNTLTTSTLILSMLEAWAKGRKVRSARKHPERYEPSNAIKNIEIREDFSKMYSFADDLYAALFRPRLKESTIPLLTLLKKHQKKIAIFSDAKTYRLMKEVRTLGVAEHIDFALSAESIDFYKPNPTGLLLMRDKFKTRKEKTIYIGDMVSDVLTAKFAGMDVCAVADGIDGKGVLKEAKPNYVFDSLSDFMQALEG